MRRTSRVGIWSRMPMGPWGVLAAALVVIVMTALPAGRAWTPHASAQSLSVSSPTVQVSQCGGYNSEVEEAVNHNFVFDVWIGCNRPGSLNIGFARSTDGGHTFGSSVTVPGSFSATNPYSYSWDPAITVGRNGILYASFMFFNADTSSIYPVVAASFDHGQSFAQVSSLPVPPSTDPYGDWGDRDFIAVSANGTVYVTWDYGPSASEIRFNCSPTGSCAYAGGDFNAVIQKSTDGGKTWTSVSPISSGFPLGGVYSAPILVQPDGTIDVLLLRHPTDATTLDVSPGGEYFTHSVDGGVTWSAPIQVGPSAGTISLDEWWIDGSIGTDQAGNLYVTWDTQSDTTDVGWLSYSTNGGTSWSNPIRVTPDQGNSEQLVEVVGAGPGSVYVAWQTPAAPQGYATYIRPFSIAQGWMAPTTQVSTQYGNPNVWPGDTFGLATLDTAAHTSIGPSAVLSWGSAVNGQPSEIFSSNVSLGP